VESSFESFFIFSFYHIIQKILEPRKKKENMAPVQKVKKTPKRKTPLKRKTPSKAKPECEKIELTGNSQAEWDALEMWGKIIMMNYPHSNKQKKKSKK
jgi:hypothetical protein